MAEAPVVRHCKLLTFKRFLVTGIDVNSIRDLEQGDGPILHGRVDGHLNSLLREGHGEVVINVIMEYCERVPKVGALIFALACCSCFRGGDVMKQAYAKLNKVCRIPTHLFQFVSIQQQLVEARRRRSDNFISRRLKRVTKRRRQFSDSAVVSASSSSDAGSQETKIFCKKSTGWGAKRKKGIASFYTDANKNALRLLYLVTKYKRRHNWSHEDILLFTHLKFSNLIEGKELVLTYSRYGYHHKKYISLKSRMSTSPVNETVGRVIDLIDVLERIKALTPDDDTANIDTLCSLIEKYGKLCCEEEWENVCYLYGQMNRRNNSEEIQRKSFGICKEHVPTKFFQYPEVWKRLLPNMALGCMIRNLGKMTELKLFDDQENVNRVTSALRDPEILRRARIHPLSILIALHTYQKGESDQSKLKWNPNPEISGALDEAFHQSFDSGQLFLDSPTNKKFYLAIDCSTIMKESECYHCDVISPVTAAAALTLVMRKMEPRCQVVAFGEDLADNVPVAETISETVTQIEEYAKSNNLGGEIDPTVVIQNARDKRIEVDVFIFFTACKGLKGDATDMLQKYRSTMENPDAKLIVCAMSSNDETIVQADDPFVLHVCGFDQNMLTTIREFVSLSKKDDCPCCRAVENDEEDSEGDD
ncbi:RNA-binding protein RO60-like isoform X2 [Hydractinia symbiolongicarpus]|nr:RNA-binding protein RO60-like isoform X2 [Hydractinia symbiolongicarpus]XP_057299960.1 RNA-binding protein RO60-like isoform X2 [Hydractinia symbiolongicarpus]XP_057299961.1 RNA-binding protein RO60-like isoform X2 [Hydractinia symbiolongicarpus]